ncbi:MAG TPA: hypothetical protein V6D48_16765 [Oculatellaceae cyanobacterium]
MSHSFPGFGHYQCDRNNSRKAYPFYQSAATVVPAKKIEESGTSLRSLNPTAFNVLSTWLA